MPNPARYFLTIHAISVIISIATASYCGRGCTMSDKNLQTFKASDLQKPTKKGGSEKKAATPAQHDVKVKKEETSVGFEAIERTLDTMSHDEIKAQLAELIEQIESLGDQANNNRGKSEADKAIIAVERTSELLAYLYKTRDDIMKEAEAAK
jgi:hypothetical protein